MKAATGEPVETSTPDSGEGPPGRRDWLRIAVWGLVASAVVGTAALALGPIAIERFGEWQEEVGSAADREASERALAAANAIAIPGGLRRADCSDPFMSTWCATTSLEPEAGIQALAPALADVSLELSGQRCVDERGVARCRADVSLDGRDAGVVFAFRSDLAWNGWREPTNVVLNLFTFDFPSQPRQVPPIDRKALLAELEQTLPAATRCVGNEACRKLQQGEQTSIDLGATVPTGATRTTLTSVGATLYERGLRSSSSSRDGLLIMETFATSGVTGVIVRTVETEEGTQVRIYVA
jgi:hypothetical protein